MSVLVLVEHDGSQIKDATLATVTAAAQLGEVHALVVGNNAGGIGQAAAKIASDAIRGDITRQEAEKRLQELPDPLTLWKKSQANGGTQPADVGPPPAGIDPSTWKFMTPEERALWQQ